VKVDNGARAVSVAGVPVITWTGNIESFTIGHPLLRSYDAVVSFVGTDAAENLTLADVPMGDVDMGGGDDAFTVQSYNHAYIPRSSSGGTGHDRADILSICRSLDVRLDRTAGCNGVSGPFGGFEDVSVTAGFAPSGTATLVGTPRAERLLASGRRVIIRGGGGADVIGVDDSYSARVRAGAGRDRVFASGDDVVVRGQTGRDRILLGGTAGVGKDPVSRRKQQVAMGGRGADTLVGTSAPRDRLLGGPGRDRANGRTGDSDLCRAEETLHCERG